MSCSSSRKVMDRQSWRSKKISRPFWFEATFFMSLYGESLLFERPGFESRTCQTLRAYIFAAFLPTWPKITFFERSDLYLLV